MAVSLARRDGVSAVALAAVLERLRRRRAPSSRRTGEPQGPQPPVERADHAAAARDGRHGGRRALAGALRCGRGIDSGAGPALRAAVLGVRRRARRGMPRYRLEPVPGVVGRRCRRSPGRMTRRGRSQPSPRRRTCSASSRCTAGSSTTRTRHPGSSTRFAQTAAGCPGYQLAGRGRHRHLSRRPGCTSRSRRPAPVGTRVLLFSEDVGGVRHPRRRRRRSSSARTP